ncbi:hypothetical protein GL218_05974 [Daldinia childiae]|uniref:uncharacterized protein n=1 Tax=Daldinia childiae TaxID=326645 RepID=UPI0014482B05|nr:uncharacterized protein GL218_05974 [Daldinia childiae]KAF3057098.1 hypothetical protein GL218_05974 [Daldinia childiae]
MASEAELRKFIHVGFLVSQWVDRGRLQSEIEYLRRMDLYKKLGDCPQDKVLEFVEYVTARPSNCDGLERFFNTGQWLDLHPYDEEAMRETQIFKIDQQLSQLDGSTMDDTNPSQGDIDMCRADESEPDAYIGEFHINGELSTVGESHINGELDIDIDEDESDYEGADTSELLCPFNAFFLGTNYTMIHWPYPATHMTWVKRVWCALDFTLPEIAKDAAAMILLADRKKGCTLSPVFKFLNQQAKLKMQSVEAYSIPRLYLAILQAMAVCDDEAKSYIYKLVPSLNLGECSLVSDKDLLNFRGIWHWGSSRSIIDVFPTHPPKGHKMRYATLSLTDDFKWPVDWAMDWDEESSKGERLCFEKIAPHWEANLMMNNRLSNVDQYYGGVCLAAPINPHSLTKVPQGLPPSDIKRYMDMMQSAVKYQTLKGQLKLMINNDSINGDSVDKLLEQVERI